MTVVNINLAVPAPDGSLAPASGLLRFTPTQRRTSEGGAVVLPVRFQADLVEGAVDVDLAPTEPGWVWRIDEHVIGSMGRTIYTTIPEDGPVQYSELVPLDPGSLAPAPSADPAWVAPLNELAERLSATTITPDPDHPGLYLIGT